MGDRVHAGRIRRGLSRKLLAQRAGVHVATVTRMERRMDSVNMEDAVKICGELEFSVEYVLTGNCGMVEYIRMQQRILNLPGLNEKNLQKVATAFWDTVPQGGRGIVKNL